MHTPKETNKKITLKTNKFLVVSDADVVESVVVFFSELKIPFQPIPFMIFLNFISIFLIFLIAKVWTMHLRRTKEIFKKLSTVNFLWDDFWSEIFFIIKLAFWIKYDFYLFYYDAILKGQISFK